MLTPLFSEVNLTLLDRMARLLGWHGYELASLLSVLLVSLVCGMVGSLVVGNRMAFFSDAMCGTKPDWQATP